MWLDNAWKKNIWNPVKNTVNPPRAVLPGAPTVEGAMASNPEYKKYYEQKALALEQMQGQKPQGYSDEALSSLRGSMSADRENRLQDARFRTSERAIDLGRADSSMTNRDLNTVETGFEREANLSDAQLLMSQDDSIKRDRAYIDQLKSNTFNEMMGITNQAMGVETNKYNRDVQQAQLDNERNTRNNQLFTDTVGAIGGNYWANLLLKKKAGSTNTGSFIKPPAR